MQRVGHVASVKTQNYCANISCKPFLLTWRTNFFFISLKCSAMAQTGYSSGLFVKCCWHFGQFQLLLTSSHKVRGLESTTSVWLAFCFWYKSTKMYNKNHVSTREIMGDDVRYFMMSSHDESNPIIMVPNSQCDSNTRCTFAKALG